MNSRTRRLIVGAVVLVAVLVIGRWTVAAVAERWWAMSISPAAAGFVTRWQMLGLALDAAAIVIASGWFAAQALLVARSIAAVEVERDLGNLRVREAVPGRLLAAGAVATGVLLGVLTGAGARAWRVPMALAWEGVAYGIRDPILGVDVGTYVAELPLWIVAHRFVLTLATLGLAITVVLYVAVGAIRRVDGSLDVHADARRHLGSLLALLALVVGAGYLLAPYGLAAGNDGLSGVAIATRVTAMQAMAGACLAVAAMCLTWVVRGRNSLVAAGWIILGFGALIERVVIPALATEATAAPARHDALRALDAVAWGLHIDSTAATSSDTIPPIAGVWDEGMLAREAEQGDGVLLAATPLAPDGANGATWLAAVSRGESRALQVRYVAEPGVAGPIPARQWQGIGTARVRPDAPSWRPANAVPSGGFASRLVLAWARQAAGMLAVHPEGGVDWHLDPADRARALVPMATWSTADLVPLDGKLTWMVQGFVTMANFPLTRRTTWNGESVSGVVPAFVALIDLVTGGTRIFSDPAADSLSLAWARYIGPMIEPSAAIPAAAREALLYPRQWFEAQLSVLSLDRWGAGVRPGRRSPEDLPEAPVVVWDGFRPTRQAVFEDPARRTVSAIVDAQRVGGMPRLHLIRPGPQAAPPNSRELERIWSRFIPAQQLRDSARAAGDTVYAGTVRWHAGPVGLAAWQPIVAVPSDGARSLLWIGTALRTQVAGGRTPDDAWITLLSRPNQRGDGTAEGATLDAARRWMDRADSALARRDLVGFGRALDALREALGDSRP